MDKNDFVITLADGFAKDNDIIATNKKKVLIAVIDGNNGYGFFNKSN